MKHWYHSRFKKVYLKIALKFFTSPENVHRIAQGKSSDNRFGCIVKDLVRHGVIR